MPQYKRIVLRLFWLDRHSNGIIPKRKMRRVPAWDNREMIGASPSFTPQAGKAAGISRTGCCFKGCRRVRRAAKTL